MRVAVNDTELYFDVEGGELAFDAAGVHARPTLVVLHGGPGFDQGYLRPALRPLADVAQLVFVDLRGGGRSARPSVQTCTLEQMADDVAALCRMLGIERPVVFGHCAGGFVALHLALRHPDVPAGLILCDSAATMTGLPNDDPSLTLAERADEEAVAAADRLFGGDFSSEAQMLFTVEVLPYYAAPGRDDLPGRLMELTTVNPDVTRYFYVELMSRYDVRDRLHEIAMPTLAIVGEYDWICPPAASRSIVDGVASGRLVVLPDAGHFGFSETPEPFLVAVRQYLAEASQPPVRSVLSAGHQFGAC